MQTARALENFQISGVNTNHYPGFFEAWAIVKLAAARTNTDVGAMKKEKLALIEKACQAVRDGKYHDHVIPELVNLVAFRVMGNDYTVTLVASDELNPQKARVLLSLALLKTRTPQEIQRLFHEY